jgi:ABC-type ATPase with predicted acetyltransferase domain
MKPSNDSPAVPFHACPETGRRRSHDVRVSRVEAALDRTTPALPGPGEIVLIIGASGAGKTRLLRSVIKLARRLGWSIHRPMPAPGSQTVRGSVDVGPALLRDRLLSRFGLAEAGLLDRAVRHISTGQRARLAIVRALTRVLCASDGRAVLVIDEFASQLDRVTAGLVAHALRRAIDDAGGRVSALLAGSQDDLVSIVPADRVLDVDAGQIRELSAIDQAVENADFSGVRDDREGSEK